MKRWRAGAQGRASMILKRSSRKRNPEGKRRSEDHKWVRKLTARFGVGVIKDWDSKWYAGKANFADAYGRMIRIHKRRCIAGVSKVLISRAAENKIRVNRTGRPGMVIGRSGTAWTSPRAARKDGFGKNIEISDREIRRSELDACAHYRERSPGSGEKDLFQKSHEAGDADRSKPEQRA